MSTRHFGEVQEQDPNLAVEEVVASLESIAEQVHAQSELRARQYLSQHGDFEAIPSNRHNPFLVESSALHSDAAHEGQEDRFARPPSSQDRASSLLAEGHDADELVVLSTGVVEQSVADDVLTARGRRMSLTVLEPTRQPDRGSSQSFSTFESPSQGASVALDPTPIATAADAALMALRGAWLADVSLTRDAQSDSARGVPRWSFDSHAGVHDEGAGNLEAWPPIPGAGPSPTGWHSQTDPSVGSGPEIITQPVAAETSTQMLLDSIANPVMAGQGMTIKDIPEQPLSGRSASPAPSHASDDQRPRARRVSTLPTRLRTSWQPKTPRGLTTEFPIASIDGGDSPVSAAPSLGPPDTSSNRSRAGTPSRRPRAPSVASLAAEGLSSEAIVALANCRSPQAEVASIWSDPTMDHDEAAEAAPLATHAPGGMMNLDGWFNGAMGSLASAMQAILPERIEVDHAGRRWLRRISLTARTRPDTPLRAFVAPEHWHLTYIIEPYGEEDDEHGWPDGFKDSDDCAEGSVQAAASDALGEAAATSTPRSDAWPQPSGGAAETEASAPVEGSGPTAPAEADNEDDRHSIESEALLSWDDFTWPDLLLARRAAERAAAVAHATTE